MACGPHVLPQMEQVAGRMSDKSELSPKEGRRRKVSLGSTSAGSSSPMPSEYEVAEAEWTPDEDCSLFQSQPTCQELLVQELRRQLEESFLCEEELKMDICNARHALGKALEREEALRAGEEKLQRIGKALIALSTCPVSHRVFREPDIAKDGHTYEPRSVQKWLKSSSTSPTTREPLKSSDLVPNRVAAEIVQILSREFPNEVQAEMDESSNSDEDEAEEAGSQFSTEPRLQHFIDTERELRELRARVEMIPVLAEAVSVGDTSRALALLSSDPRLADSNLHLPNDKMPLLHFAICSSQTEVALEIVDKCDCLIASCYSLSGWTPLHYACALNQVGLCEALIRKCGLEAADARLRRPCQFRCWDGRVVLLQAGTSVRDTSRLLNLPVLSRIFAG